MDRAKLRETLGMMSHQLDGIAQMLDENARSALQGNGNYQFNDLRVLQKFREEFDAIRETIDKTWIRGKVVSTQEYLGKIASHLVELCNKQSLPVTIGLNAKGQVPSEMIETCSKIVFRCIERFVDFADRSYIAAKTRRETFTSIPIYMSSNCDENGFHFSISANISPELYQNSGTNTLVELRIAISKLGGWLSETMVSNQAVRTEFKIPFQRAVFDAVLVNWEDAKAFLPCAYLIDQVHPLDPRPKPKLLCRLNEERGLIDATNDEIAKAGSIAIVGVADVVFGILSQKKNKTFRVRSIDVKEFIQNDSWYEKIGAVDSDSSYLACPLMEGKILTDLISKQEKSATGQLEIQNEN